jgi:hypothetical protein
MWKVKLSLYLIAHDAMNRARDMEVQLHELFNLRPHVSKRVASHTAHWTHTGIKIVTHGLGVKVDLSVVCIG